MTETILLVEDDESLRRLAQRLLARRGYNVLTAGDGKSAVTACRDCPSDIHLLITDVFMPDINGPDLANQLLVIRPAMKVLYVSGSDDVLRDGSLAPSSNFLQKPYAQDQIGSKIREILDQ